ncbi:hypothetical protein BaRGS_00003135 [Batillaria attramentaria]|uniref:C2H2-type domain-containing protein n=1 Tax=Batillaria attramentaria TaxID=370345 RepID=A0ABD0M1S7_9CAEN
MLSTSRRRETRNTSGAKRESVLQHCHRDSASVWNTGWQIRVNDVYLDYLTCGKCAQEFPLPNITDFINHKTSTCHPQSAQQHGQGFTPGSQEPALSCFICLRDFRTARGVLQHIQFEHNLKIFMQKAPLSVDRPFLVDDKQTSPAPSAENGTSPRVTTLTTTTSNQAATVMHISDNITVSRSKKSNLPVTCAKLASLDGATICCSGAECKVTINPKSTSAPKKCCSSVVPKKRDRHMKEHESEDAELAHQEQSALETLATLRGRVLLNQQARACQSKTQKIQIISISDECITDQHTVIVKPGVTLTMEKTPPNSTADNQLQQSTLTSADDSFDQDQTTRAMQDANRESAQILAEMMYQAVTQSQIPQILPAQDSAVHLQPSMTLALAGETMSQTTLAEPPSSFFATPSASFSAVPLACTSYIPQPPFSQDSNLSNPASSSVTERLPQSVDVQQLPDLDMLSPSIRLFESLEQVSVGTSGVPSPGATPFDSSSGNCGVGDGSGQTMQEEVDSCTQGSRKRRYPTSRPFKCSDCDQAFNQRIHLKKHMSKHTGVKPFKCSVCQYSTVERSHLRAHVRIHTGEKPFSCPHCDYATAQNSTLKIHLKRHHKNQKQET